MKCFLRFVGMTLLTSSSKLNSFIISSKLIRISPNFVQGFFSIKLRKQCHKNRAEVLTSGHVSRIFIPIMYKCQWSSPAEYSKIKNQRVVQSCLSWGPFDKVLQQREMTNDSVFHSCFKHYKCYYHSMFASHHCQPY